RAFRAGSGRACRSSRRPAGSCGWPACAAAPRRRGLRRPGVSSRGHSTPPSLGRSRALRWRARRRAMTARFPRAVHFILPVAFPLFVAPVVSTAADERVDSHSVLRALEDAFVSVADRVTPAVVNVSVKAKRGTEGDDPEERERFREFFGPE